MYSGRFVQQCRNIELMKTRVYSNLLPSDLDDELCDEELRDDLELELDDELRRRSLSDTGERERDLER